jgi:hypothetical protein
MRRILRTPARAYDVRRDRITPGRIRPLARS